MSSFNLKTCSGVCTDCVKSYSVKHRLGKGGKFDIRCGGIPLQYISDDLLASLGCDPKAAIAMLDPVTWANKFLDWHCTDPDGSIWKRKTAEGTIGGAPLFEPNNPDHIQRIKEQKSPFHRPYQEALLRCSSKRKVFRLGRQLGKSEVLVISILFNLFTKEKFNIQLIAPYQTQVDLVFTRIVELIKSNVTLSNSVERSVKAPNYQIILKNDSKLIGFTAGTRSGQEAGAARGQNANMLVFDEADYLSPKDVDAALAVIINHPDATVWMSSTPTGRREKFFDTCQNSLYREFNFPSMINPNWDESLDRYYRSELTEDGWLHEIEAKFGDQEEGVYQIKYVEAAQDGFEYGPQNLDPSHVYTIGVDWNDVKVGTTIAVVGYNPRTGTFSLVDKDIVSRAERTQLSACEKIAELNRIWNPVAIYVDSGFGTTQVEVLHDYGQQAVMRQGANSPDARLRNIVKEYDFGGSIEIHDLFTHQPVKKPAKPFLVENSVRRFENLTFKYPISDKSYSDQLMGYIVERVSNTGRPVYKARNENVGDHFLDAVNLALVAFTLEKGKFGKPTFSAGVTFAPRFGEGMEEAKREQNPGESYSKKADHYRPAGGRSAFADKNKRILPSAHGDMPASNLAQNNNRLWEWPGWGRDSPRPKVRTWDEAMSQAEKRVRGTRQPPPRRAKF